MNIVTLSATIFEPFGGDDAIPAVPFLIYVNPRAAQLFASSSDADIFGVDPRAAVLVVITSDIFGVDPRAAQLVSAPSDADPFGVDPRAATLVS